VASGQNVSGAVLPRGTVLGIVTTTGLATTGQAIVSKATATDGSQVPTGVLTDDVDTSVAAVVAQEYETGVFAYEIANIDPSWTIATLNRAFQAKGQPVFFRSVGVAA